MIEAVMAGLVRANLALAAGVLLAWALRRPVRRLFGARAAYALWAAAPLAAAASLLPPRAEGALLAPFVAGAATPLARLAAPAAAQAPALPWAVALWLAGAAAALVLLARQQAAFLAEVRAGRAGPAVVGAIAPRIVTPDDFEVRFAPAERALILAHERVHLTGGDAQANALAAALQCLCWFNPLAHLGVRLMRIDQELACDAAVLAHQPQSRRLYAEVLLKSQLVRQSAPLACQWPAGAAHPLKERIVTLKSPLPGRSRRALGAAIAALLAGGGAAAAWAAQSPPKTPVIAQPDWVQRPTADDVARYYPPAAAAQKLAGLAVIACKVSAEGRLTACDVAREDPAGAGFGEAALQMSAQFQMRPMTKDGRPVAGGAVRIPIRFVVP